VRRRLVLLSLATTVLVVVSFVVPLALLVRQQAADAAKVRAEGEAQSTASLVALAMAVGETPEAVAGAVGNPPAGTIVVLESGPTLGEALPGQGSLVAQAAGSRTTVAGDVPGGWEIALPVVGTIDTAVVDVFVTDAELSRGISVAWLLLAVLALVLIGVAVWVADRMGRGLVAPIEDLADSAKRLAEGDLARRVTPGEPEEIREVGEAFNYLADRLDVLLAEERETVADISHRLRTPLTSLRLQAESLSDPGERQVILTQVDRLEHAMSQVIELARSVGARGPETCVLDDVVGKRAEFWRLLAEEQNREVSVLLGDAGLVPLGQDDLGVIIDTLIENVFAHTAAATDFEIMTGRSARGGAWLEISDRGPGFGGLTPLERGVSGAGSTGLGLDIVRKTATASGGTVQLDDRPGGGAVVKVTFG